jgi:hypothetical protein
MCVSRSTGNTKHLRQILPLRPQLDAYSFFSFDSEPIVDGSALSSLLLWTYGVSSDERSPNDSGSSAKTCQ